MTECKKNLTVSGQELNALNSIYNAIATQRCKDLDFGTGKN